MQELVRYFALCDFLVLPKQKPGAVIKTLPTF